MGQCGAHLHEQILSASIKSQVADLWMIWLRMFRVRLTCETANPTCNPMISRFTPCFIFLPFTFLLLPPFPCCSLFPFLLSSCWKTSLIFPSSHALWNLDQSWGPKLSWIFFFFFLEIRLHLLRNHEAWQTFDMLDISGQQKVWAAVP